MNNIQISQALKKLRPNSEFTFNDNDLDSLIWLSDDEQPTKEQILEAIEQLEKDKVIEAEAKATTRKSALAKLAELGLTADEIASL